MNGLNIRETVLVRYWYFHLTVFNILFIIIINLEQISKFQILKMENESLFRKIFFKDMLSKSLPNHINDTGSDIQIELTVPERKHPSWNLVYNEMKEY